MGGNKDCVMSQPLEIKQDWLGSKGGFKIQSFDLVIFTISRNLGSSSCGSDGRYIVPVEWGGSPTWMQQPAEVYSGSVDMSYAVGVVC